MKTLTMTRGSITVTGGRKIPHGIRQRHSRTLTYQEIPACASQMQGDGLPHLIQGWTDSEDNSHYGAWANNNSYRADILTSITYPQGGSSTIAYEAAADYLDGLSGPANVAPYPVYVVSKVTTNDGFGNLASSTYQYSGGTYYYDSPIDHQLAGFSVVTETDPGGQCHEDVLRHGERSHDRRSRASYVAGLRANVRKRLVESVVRIHAFARRKRP